MDIPTADHPDHPMHIRTPPLSLYLGSMIGPIVAATALRLADWKLPELAAFTLTLGPLFYHVCALGLLWKQTFVRRLPGSALFWTLFFASTRWVCFNFVAKERWLVVSFALDVVLPTSSIASWKHLQADSSDEQQSFGITMAQNFAVMYALCSILLVRYVVVIWTAKVVGFLVCYILGLVVLDKLIKSDAYWLGFGFHFSNAVDLFHEGIITYLTLEALAMEKLPRWVQRRYSRLAQHERETNGVQAYKYRQLKEGEIRLLVIKHSSRMLPSVIEASMIHVTLEEVLDDGTDIEFEAISYRWGSANRIDSILIDGGDFRVTESAFNVLMARRSMFKDRTLWIDAICINQSDGMEKTRQIQMMGKIYSGAYRVVAIPNCGWQARLAAQTLIELRVISQISGIDVNDLGLKYKRRRSAVVSLLTSEYFSRAWIIQELALGKVVELYMGGMYMPFHHYMGIVDHLVLPTRMRRLTETDSRFETNRIPDVRISNAIVISFMKYAIRASADEMTLEAVSLIAALYFDATDPRDTIFSVLGLVKDDSENQLLKPDYTKSVEQVFEDLAEYMFVRSPQPSILLLALAGVGYPQSRRPLPSWVPDLAQERVNDPFTLPALFISATPFRTSGESTPEVTTAGSDSHLLRVSGILCDNIIGLSSAGPLELGHPGKSGDTFDLREVAKAQVAFLKAAKETIERHGHLWRAGPEEPLSDLWRVLVADQISRGGVHEDLKSDNFHHWVRYLEVLANLTDRQDPDLAFLESGWPEEQHIKFSPDSYASAFGNACTARCFALSESGRMCLVPPLTELGDVIFVPFGAQVPHLIRKVALSDGHNLYTLIGEAYVHAIMKGELLEAPYVKTAVLIQ